MAEVLALLLGDDQLRNRMGDEDRRIALETFTPERMMKSLIQIYKQ